jgi:hypothetical protein
LFSALFCISPLFAQKKQPEIQKSKRIEKIINSQWTFNYFPSETADKGYEAYGFNDYKWPAISLPHTWNTYETTGELNTLKNSSEDNIIYWRNGWGWYRKHFTVSSAYADRKVFIEFEGVQRYCKVWINGKYLGDHTGGYGSFDFDITQYIKPIGENVLAVAVSNKELSDDQTASSGNDNFRFSGGIFRNVTLVLKDKLFIPMQGAANHEGGTFVTTPKVTEKEGIVRVQTWVKNDNLQKKSCLLQTSIIDGSNKTIQVIKTDAVINPGQLFKFDQTFKPVKKPHLWSTSDPYLYKIYSEVIDGSIVSDLYTTQFGFRWFRVEPKESSVYVNNKALIPQIVLWNINYPWIGFAIPKWMTDLNFNSLDAKANDKCIRTGSDPVDKTVFDMSDNLGVIVDYEIPVELQDQQIREIVRRDRNHPGILFWSLTGEDKQGSLKKIVLAEDTTRILNSILFSANPPMAGISQNSSALSDSQTSATGDPVKIVLTCSHQKILADRGSIALLTADIVDSQGKPVKGATNTIKWEVTGPATLVGPAVFEKSIDKNKDVEGAWYKGIPVSNIIRSTGESGKIRISVYSSGLTSATIEFWAQEYAAENTVITESVLNNEGRRSVTRPLLNADRLDDIPREIQLTSDKLKFNALDKTEYARQMKDYILKNNPSVDPSLVEFKALTDLLASALYNNSGNMSAEDYNYNIDHYNNCRLIAGYINATKLPPQFKDGLKTYYSNSIIRDGSEKNAGDEMNWLNWIPSGGTVVVYQTGANADVIKGVIISEKDDLTDIIAEVYPQFPNFSDEAKERALIFINKMNPYVYISDKEKNSISYKAEKGKTILIPLLKFISE